MVAPQGDKGHDGVHPCRAALQHIWSTQALPRLVYPPGGPIPREAGPNLALVRKCAPTTRSGPGVPGPTPASSRAAAPGLTAYFRPDFHWVRDAPGKTDPCGKAGCVALLCSLHSGWSCLRWCRWASLASSPRGRSPLGPAGGTPSPPRNPSYKPNSSRNRLGGAPSAVSRIARRRALVNAT